MNVKGTKRGVGGYARTWQVIRVCHTEYSLVKVREWVYISAHVLRHLSMPDRVGSEVLSHFLSDTKSDAFARLYIISPTL